MKFDIDDEELATCVGCGLCLPHCPTFRVSGEEALSPRGRIAAIRQVHLEEALVTNEFVHFMETCVQCRGCEPACPSGVPYGHLQEGVRRTLAAQHRTAPWWQRLGYRALLHHRLLLLGSSVLAVAQRLRLVPTSLGLSRIPVRRGKKVRSTGTDVWLFTGCVMDAWMRATHRNTALVLQHLDIRYSVPGAGGACCGALHVHAGIEAEHIAERVMRSMPGDAPIVVNSAGCGAALKDYGHLLGTAEAATFSARVLDIHEFLAAHAHRLNPQRHLGRVIVQDPCHLRHVQKAHGAVRQVLARVATLVELDDDGLCCGAGGAYSALEPQLAAQVRDRKLESVARVGGGLIASANPGCAMHLAAAGATVRHPIDLLAEAIGVAE